MSKKLSRVTASTIIKILERMGFRLSRQSGSHKIYTNTEGRRVTVPYHSVQILHPKILKNIMEDANLTKEDLKK